MVRRALRVTAVFLLLLGLGLPPSVVQAEPSGSATPAPAAAMPPADSASSSGPASDSAPSGYADLPATHWAYPAVMQLRQAGVLSAAPSGLFRPDEPVTRAEFFKMILAARRIDVGATCDGLFTDVPCWAWYAPVAEMAYRMAIAEGIGDGRFGPEEPLTREEMATVLVRALGRRWDAAQLGWNEINSRLGALTDGQAIDWWARPSVGYALGEKLATGYHDSTFRPKRLTSRAEAAAVVSRVLLPDNGLQTIEVDGRRIAYAQAMDLDATMYTSGEPGVGTITYTGLTVRTGTVAVDPSVIPLGRLLYVEGYGYVVAADIGSAIKGDRIDLYSYSLDEAIQFGIRPRRVWILP